MALTQVKSDGIADGAVTANDLENSGVTAGTYGSSSAIPAITVDAKGRVTSASTNSVTQVGGANGVDFNDSVKARFGTGNDLEIYHDGTNSNIDDAGTGVLKIRSNQINIDKYTGEALARFRADGSCELFYDNASKLNTTSGGINVTGSVNCDGLTCEGDLSIRSSYGTLLLRDTTNSGTGAQTRIVFEDSTGHTQGNVGYLANNNNDLYISNEYSTNLVFRTGGATRCFVDSGGHFNPAANNTYDLGTSALRWRNVYTNDLNLSNEGGTNDVDGTWGSWTIQEGEDDLFLLNRRNGKKYKFNLTEVN